MILTASEIEKQLELGNIEISPFISENLSVNSYDVTLNSNFVTYYDLNLPINNYCLDIKMNNKIYEYEIPDEGIILQPGILYLMRTNEICGSKIFQPCYDGRSSMARLGIQSHISAGFGDIGFCDRWTLEVTVTHPIRIYKNIRIGQVYFNRTYGDIKMTYNEIGKYNNNTLYSQSFKDKEFNR